MTSSTPSAGPANPPGPPGPPGPPRAYRVTEDAMVGGVAAGLSRHLGVPVVWLRAGFLLAAVFGGFGAVLYAAFWMVLPDRRHFEATSPGLAAATRQGRRTRTVRPLSDYGPMVALGAIVLGLLVLLTWATGRASIIWPVLLATAGVAVLWRQADEAQRDRWLDSTGRLSLLRLVLGAGGWASWARVLAGVALLVVAITVFSFRSGSLGAALDVGLAALLGIVGLAFIAGPWLLRLTSDLAEERAERVRSQERADVAAHLHDSVLQTLAMIQKSATDPARVSQLARAQERDLRSWLYDDPATTSDGLLALLRRAAAEVEDTVGVPVEVVGVGEREPSRDPRPLVLAAREAMLNAARHSGAAKVDVYVEVGPATSAVFVRDRGVGFDPALVPADRHGVRDSIVDRLQRHGGTAEIISGPGAGTEVRLQLPEKEAP